VKVSAWNTSYSYTSDDARILLRAGQETETANVAMFANLASSYSNIRHAVLFPVDTQAMIRLAAAGAFPSVLSVLPHRSLYSSLTILMDYIN